MCISRYFQNESCAITVGGGVRRGGSVRGFGLRFVLLQAEPLHYPYGQVQL